MAFAVPKRGFTNQPTGKQSKRVKDSSYLDFIRSLPCIVTGRMPAEARKALGMIARIDLSHLSECRDIARAALKEASDATLY